MSDDLRALIHGEAEVGSESEDEDFDEDTGESRKKHRGEPRDFDDSSEEDEEDDEEEAARVGSILLRETWY
jgi:transcription elongation factor SPT6